eukprot:s56_g9.t1
MWTLPHRMVAQQSWTRSALSSALVRRVSIGPWHWCHLARYLEKMKCWAVRPNIISYSSAVTACEKAKQTFSHFRGRLFALTWFHRANITMTKQARMFRILQHGGSFRTHDDWLGPGDTERCSLWNLPSTTCNTSCSC